MRKSHFKKSWFTLVELIIVITILAILATIAFVSFENYTKNTRDASRVSNLKNIEKWLLIYEAKNARYPSYKDNTEYKEITWSWIFVKQWILTSQISQDLWFNKKLWDPKDNSWYIYNLTANEKKFQLGTYLEVEDELYFSLISNVYADTNLKNRFLYTIWDNVWIFVDGDNVLATGLWNTQKAIFPNNTIVEKEDWESGEDFEEKIIKKQTKSGNSGGGNSNEIDSDADNEGLQKWCFIFNSADEKEITGYKFEDQECSDLAVNLVIPDKVERIWDKAFCLKNEDEDNNCSSEEWSIESIIFNTNLKSIWDFAFAYNQIEIITFPDNIVSLWSQIFLENNPKEVIIPKYLFERNNEDDYYIIWRLNMDRLTKVTLWEKIFENKGEDWLYYNSTKCTGTIMDGEVNVCSYNDIWENDLKNYFSFEDNGLEESYVRFFGNGDGGCLWSENFNNINDKWFQCGW